MPEIWLGGDVQVSRHNGAGPLQQEGNQTLHPVIKLNQSPFKEH